MNDPVTTARTHMIVQSVWATRKGEDTPELLVAWDEFSIEQNPEGFEKEYQNAIDAMGDDLLEWRFINFEVGYHTLMSAFRPTTIPIGR